MSSAVTDLIPFSYSGRQVRTVTRDGEPWFVGRDVCAVLGIVDARASLNLLDEDERDTVPVVDSMGREQSTLIVNEPGLYSLILRSRKAEAKAFKRWIVHEVLPALRRTGRYEVTSMSPRQLAELVIAEADRADAAEAKVIELQPRAESWDTLADTGADYSVREAAYILNRDPEISTGQQRLFRLLRAWGLIDSRDRPYANHSTHVTLRPRTRTSHTTQEEVPAKPQVRVTVAGLNYLHRKLGGTAPLDVA